MTIEMLCTSLKVLNLCTLVRWSIKYTQISDTESFFFPFEFREYWNVSFSSDPSFVYLYIHSLLSSPTAEMSRGVMPSGGRGRRGKDMSSFFFGRETPTHKMRCPAPQNTKPASISPLPLSEWKSGWPRPRKVRTKVAELGRFQNVPQQSHNCSGGYCSWRFPLREFLWNRPFFPTCKQKNEGRTRWADQNVFNGGVCLDRTKNKKKERVYKGLS